MLILRALLCIYFFHQKSSEMPLACVALGCINKSSSSRGTLSFHRFPFTQPDLLEKWLTNMRRDDFVPTKSSYLCSNHFVPEMYAKCTKNGRRILKNGAIPTEFYSTHHMPNEQVMPTFHYGGGEMVLPVNHNNPECRPSCSGMHAYEMASPTKTVRDQQKTIDHLRLKVKRLRDTVRCRDREIASLKEALAKR